MSEPLGSAWCLLSLLPAMVKLAKQNEESYVDPVGYGMVFPLFSYDSNVEAHEEIDESGVNAVGYGGASHGGAIW